MTNYAKAGAAKEHVVKNAMVDAGWLHIMRAAASKGPADLLLGHPIHGGALVQVGSKSKSLGPADRARLLEAADLIGALAILAVVVPRKGIRYHVVSLGPASTWTEFTP